MINSVETGSCTIQQRPFSCLQRFIEEKIVSKEAKFVLLCDFRSENEDKKRLLRAANFTLSQFLKVTASALPNIQNF